MRKSILFTACASVSFMYVNIMHSLPETYWLHYTQRPFVYRTLVPTLANGDRLGTLFLVFAFCMALAVLVLYVYESNWDVSLTNDVVFILSFFFTIFMVTRYSNYYDIPAAFFFTVMIVLWEKKKYALSLPIFALSCLNRETTVLLIPIFAITQRNILFPIVQGAMFFAIRKLVAFSFAGTSGEDAYFRLAENLNIHAENLGVTVAMLSIMAGLIVLMLYNFKNWQYATFIILLFPMLFSIYAIFGYPFEIRVFAEVAPLLFLGAFMKGVNNEAQKESEKSEVGEIPAMWNAEQDMLPR